MKRLRILLSLAFLAATCFYPGSAFAQTGRPPPNTRQSETLQQIPDNPLSTKEVEMAEKFLSDCTGSNVHVDREMSYAKGVHLHRILAVNTEEFMDAVNRKNHLHGTMEVDETNPGKFNILGTRFRPSMKSTDFSACSTINGAPREMIR